MVLKSILFFALFVASFKDVELRSTNMIMKNDSKFSKNWPRSIWMPPQLESTNMKNECVPCGLLRPDCDGYCCSCLLCPCCPCPN